MLDNKPSSIERENSDLEQTNSIDENVVDEYLSQVNFNSLDKNRFELTQILPTDKQRFTEMENEKLDNL